MEMLLRFLYGFTSTLTSAGVFEEDLHGCESVLYDTCFKYDVPATVLAAELLFEPVLSH